MGTLLLGVARNEASRPETVLYMGQGGYEQVGGERQGDKGEFNRTRCRAQAVGGVTTGLKSPLVLMVVKQEEEAGEQADGGDGAHGERGDRPRANRKGGMTWGQ